MLFSHTDGKRDHTPSTIFWFKMKRQETEKLKESILRRQCMGKAVKESHPKQSLNNSNRKQKLKSCNFAAGSLKIPKAQTLWERTKEKNGNEFFLGDEIMLQNTELAWSYHAVQEKILPSPQRTVIHSHSASQAFPRSTGLFQESQTLPQLYFDWR